MPKSPTFVTRNQISICLTHQDTSAPFKLPQTFLLHMLVSCQSTKIKCYLLGLMWWIVELYFKSVHLIMWNLWAFKFKTVSYKSIFLKLMNFSSALTVHYTPIHCMCSMWKIVFLVPGMHSHYNVLGLKFRSVSAQIL